MAPKVQAQYVGFDPCIFQGEEFAGAAEPCGDLIEYQQYIKSITQRAQFDQVFR